MKPYLPALVFALIALGTACSASGQEKSPDPGKKADEQIVHVQKLLAETMVEIKDWPKELPLNKFLTALEGQLPKDKRFSFRLDEEAFGQELPRVAGASVKCPNLKNVTLQTVLRKALSQVAAQAGEVDYAIRPGGVVITRPPLAAHSMAYTVHDLVEQMPPLPPGLVNDSDRLFADLKPTDGAAMLVRLLTNCVDLRPWETIQVLNGVRLSVHASPIRHDEVVDLLDALRRLADVYVVMNARLYEVDRAFFTKNVAPLFAKDKDAEERPAIVRIDGPLLKKITAQKLLLESEDIKLRPGQEVPFLSQHSVFRFEAGPPVGKEDGAMKGTGMAGVSFAVRPLVSPDRRSLRLQVSQQVAQLVGIEKTRMLDVFTGKEVEVESPNVRKTTLTGTIQVLDGNPLLMPVTYRPPGKGGEDKVWLLMARPFIWIGEEVKEIRRQGGDLTPQSIWESETQEEGAGRAAPGTRLPFNDQVKEILQAILTDVLTNPELKRTREFYGTAKDRTLILFDETLGWPTQFKPETHGYRLVEVEVDPFVNQRRILGIRLDKFDLKQKKSDLFNTPIEVCLFNAGGSANGGVIGGCTVYYVPKRVGKRWTVEYAGAIDP